MIFSPTAQEQQEGGAKPVQPTKPLVSIGIPSYNRAALLQRAMESVLSQDYDNIELIVSDNASTDGTQALCEEFCRRDSRVRYIRQPVNRGANANFIEVSQRSRGEYYMVIGDDDWLDISYVSQCLQALIQDPELVLVCGISRWFQGQTFLGDEHVASLLHDTGRERVLEYYRKVDGNGMFHGLIRRKVLTGLPLPRNVFGGDWLYVASIAFTGKCAVLESTAVNKLRGGISEHVEKTVEMLRLPRFQGSHPYLSLAIYASVSIMRDSPVYKSLKLSDRYLLALDVFRVMDARFDLIKSEIRKTRPYHLYSRIKRILSKSRGLGRRERHGGVGLSRALGDEDGQGGHAMGAGETVV